MKRGLSLLELILALSVTAIVALAITGMMGAVSTGVEGRRDTRSVLVLANAAASRLSSYVAPSCCILSVGGSDITLWFNDSRESDTVHATEIRWLTFDSEAGTLAVNYVEFPSAWSKAACDLADEEYAADASWAGVRAKYQGSGWLASRILVDDLASVTILKDQATAQASRFLSFELGFETKTGVVPVTVAAAITQHNSPSS